MKYCYDLDYFTKFIELCRIMSFDPQTLDEIIDKIHKIFHKENKSILRSQIQSMIAILKKYDKVEEIE
jgi:hypothetical protein